MAATKVNLDKVRNGHRKPFPFTVVVVVVDDDAGVAAVANSCVDIST